MSLASVNGTGALAELAARANSEYELVRRAGEQMVAHAVRCGEALLEAHGHVAEGQWLQWMKDNLTALSPTTAYKYMRLARHSARVLAGGRQSIDEALASIADEPWHRRTKLQATEKQEMLRLATEDGLTTDEIAETFNVSKSTAWYWTSEKNRKKRGTQRRQTRARQRAAEVQRVQRKVDRAVKKVGGSASAGYGLLRKTAQLVDQAQAETDDRDVRAALRRSLGHLHAAEDELVRALGIEYGTVPRNRQRAAA